MAANPMDGTRSILLQISKVKDEIDKVNNEIQANIKITREIESDMIKCEEVYNELAARESELIKAVQSSQFELFGLNTVTVICRHSVTALMKEIDQWQRKKVEMLETLTKMRAMFSESCILFQNSIKCEECNEICKQLLEKAALEDEIYKLEETLALKNSVTAAVEKFELSEDHTLETEIRKKTAENEQLEKQIQHLRTTLLSTVDEPW